MRRGARKPKSRRVRKSGNPGGFAAPGTGASIVRWFNPSPDPPPVAETKWRFARLRFGASAAGDSGAIENWTPVRIFEGLKAQQGLSVDTGLASARVLGCMLYALQGVADSGGQTYPSAKLRVYTPNEDSTQGVLVAQHEDAGTIQSVARIGCKFPVYLQGRCLNSASTAYFMQTEYYHAARAYIYIDVLWATQPN